MGRWRTYQPCFDCFDAVSALFGSWHSALWPSPLMSRLPSRLTPQLSSRLTPRLTPLLTPLSAALVMAVSPSAGAVPSLTEQLHTPPADTIRSQRDVADQFLLTGKAQLNEGNHEQALVALAEAANAYHYLGDFVGMGEAYEQLVKLYSQLGRYDDAERVVRQQLAIARSNDSLTDQILALNNLGTLSLQDGDLSTAQQAFNEGLTLSQSIDSNSGIGLSMSNLGLIAVARGELNDARKYFELAAEYRARARDYAGQANTDSNLGDVYLATGRLREATGAYRLSLSLARDLDEPYIQLRALDGLIAIYRQANEPGQLMGYLNERVALTVSTGDDWQRLVTLRTLGEIYEENGDLSAAYESFQLALQLATALDRKQVQADLSNRVRALSLQLAD
jgi:tetratricopeptide (TPR) repeat protein